MMGEIVQIIVCEPAREPTTKLLLHYLSVGERYLAWRTSTFAS